MKNIYVIRANDGTVKIGVSKNPGQRTVTVARQSGKSIIDCFITEPLENAYELETQLHKQFHGQRLEGEWFIANYDTVVSAVRRIFKSNARFATESDSEKPEDGIKKPPPEGAA